MKSFLATPSKSTGAFAMLLLLASVPAFAQTPLTITSSDYQQAFINSGLPTRYTDTAITGAAGAQLQLLVTQTGANETWDFQNLPFRENAPLTGETFSVVAYPGGAALADSFPSATQVNIITYDGNTYYDFYQLTQTGYYALGASQLVNGISSISLQYSPPYELIAFPLTYGTQWTTSSVAINPGADTTNEQADFNVDSWGTIELPGNISFPALRLRQKSTQISSSYHDTSYSYAWYALSGYSASISVNAGQNALSASYSVPAAPNIVLHNAPGSSYSISTTSNPVSSQTNVSFTLPSEAQVRISLMDPLGHESHVLMNGTAHSGVNTFSLDPANLMNGMYFLRMESDGNSTMQKVIVNH
jgi:Secretion system C-terminal sorting domain